MKINFSHFAEYNIIAGSIDHVEYGENVLFELTCKMFSKSINWYKETYRLT
jgi:hypothetical protein